MDFMDAIGTCLSKYADFSGRARRAEYWWFVAFNIAISIPAAVLDGFMGAATGGIGIIGLIVALGLLIPNIAVGVRRLHDLDRTGWWYLIIFVPIIGFLVLLFFFVTRGTDGPNRFGPDPLTEGG